jgi:hypothetical protein
VKPGDLIKHADGRVGLVISVEYGPGNVGVLCFVAVIDGVEQHVFDFGHGWGLFLKRPRTAIEIHEDEIEYMRDKLLASIQVSVRDLAVYGNAYVHPVEESVEDSLKLDFTSPTRG